MPRRRAGRAETTASSDIANRPLTTTRTTTIRISTNKVFSWKCGPALSIGSLVHAQYRGKSRGCTMGLENMPQLPGRTLARQPFAPRQTFTVGESRAEPGYAPCRQAADPGHGGAGGVDAGYSGLDGQGARPAGDAGRDRRGGH